MITEKEILMEKIIKELKEKNKCFKIDGDKISIVDNLVQYKIVSMEENEPTNPLPLLIFLIVALILFF